MLPTSVEAGQSPACACPSGHFATADRLPAAPAGSDRSSPVSMSLPSGRLTTMRETECAPACSGSAEAWSMLTWNGVSGLQGVCVSENVLVFCAPL